MPSTVEITRKEGVATIDRNGLTLFDTLVFWILVLLAWNTVLTAVVGFIIWKVSRDQLKLED